MFEGIGDLAIITNDLPVNKLIELNLLNFSYESSTEVKTSQKFVAGRLRDQSSVQGAITDTLTFRINDIDWGQFQFAMGKLAKTVTAFSLPTLQYGNVPTVTPFSITDLRITAANRADIFVYLNSDSAGSPPIPLTPTALATTAPATAKEVQIDTATNKLVFHPSAAGRSFSYTVPQNISTAEAIGGPGNAVALGTFKFFGKVYSPKPTQGYNIMFPRVSLSGRPTIDFSTDVPVLEITATPATPSGYDEPFVWINNGTVIPVA